MHCTPVNRDRKNNNSNCRPNAAFGGRWKVVSPRLEVRTSHLFAFGSTGNFQLGKSRRLTESIYFVLN